MKLANLISWSIIAAVAWRLYVYAAAYGQIDAFMREMPRMATMMLHR